MALLRTSLRCIEEESQQVVPIGLNQGSCTSRMSSMSFVAKRACIAAFWHCMLTEAMEKLDIKDG